MTRHCSITNTRAFGWDYPPGAEHDPRAPYNQPEEKEDYCVGCDEPFAVSALNEHSRCEPCQRKLDEEGPQK